MVERKAHHNTHMHAPNLSLMYVRLYVRLWYVQLHRTDVEMSCSNYRYFGADHTLKRREGITASVAALDLQMPVYRQVSIEYHLCGLGI